MPSSLELMVKKIYTWAAAAAAAAHTSDCSLILAEANRRTDHMGGAGQV